MVGMKLPLQRMTLSIGIGEEPGPGPRETGQTRLDMGFETLSGAIIHQLQPEEIVSWLFCERYDAYDVGAMLHGIGFAGVYTAVTERLPNRAAVEREIRGKFPGLKFRLVCPVALSGGAARYHGFIADARLEAEGFPA